MSGGLIKIIFGRKTANENVKTAFLEQHENIITEVMNLIF